MSWLIGFIIYFLKFDFVNLTEYCSKYALAKGVYYSSCGGHCCGVYGVQHCCYHSYSADHGPAIGLGAAFGVTFGLFLCLVIFFTIKAICNSKNKETRVVKPNAEKEKVSHSKPKLNTYKVDRNKENVYVISWLKQEPPY